MSTPWGRRKYKPRTTARIDPRAEACDAGALWLARIERAVSGTSVGLWNHPTPERVAVPRGPFVALLAAWLTNEGPSAFDAVSVENIAKHAVRYARYLADEHIDQSVALTLRVLGGYRAHLTAARAGWFRQADALGAPRVKFRRQAPEVSTVRAQLNFVSVLFEFATLRGGNKLMEVHDDTARTSRGEPAPLAHSRNGTRAGAEHRTYQ